MIIDVLRIPNYLPSRNPIRIVQIQHEKKNKFVLKSNSISIKTLLLLSKVILDPFTDYVETTHASTQPKQSYFTPIILTIFRQI